MLLLLRLHRTMFWAWRWPRARHTAIT